MEGCDVTPAEAAAGELLELRISSAGMKSGGRLEVIVQVGRDRELLHQ